MYRRGQSVKVTVCELPDRRDHFGEAWNQLITHVQTQGSDLILLNEMPFSEWFCVTPHFDPATWQAAVDEHVQWLTRLEAFGSATIIASCPVTRGASRLNQGFVWNAQMGYCATHDKYYLPDEDGTWEASWYQPGNGRFDLVQTKIGNIGWLICSELWAMSRAQAYGKAGAQLLVTPRATGQSTMEKWLIGGRAAAIISGAFCLSSNRSSDSAFGGQGWVIGPDGEILGVTSQEHPFITIEIDVRQAELAKTTYPRYILE
jgi:predicted amidohydrolase